eukprot:9272884-Pyramimonas_sp.AAC.2
MRSSWERGAPLHFDAEASGSSSAMRLLVLRYLAAREDQLLEGADPVAIALRHVVGNVGSLL